MNGNDYQENIERNSIDDYSLFKAGASFGLDLALLYVEKGVKPTQEELDQMALNAWLQHIAEYEEFGNSFGSETDVQHA